jgi:hypothetical protein
MICRYIRVSCVINGRRYVTGKGLAKDQVFGREKLLGSGGSCDYESRGIEAEKFRGKAVSSTKGP